MATYTNLLRLITQATAENENVWGAALNNGMISLIDKAVAGTVSVNVTAANQVLTVANGTEDQSRYMAISATGNPGVARDITVPSLSKIYVVINNTSPVEDVQIKTAAGAGVTVTTQGSPEWVYCDGTDVIAIAPGTVALATNALQLGGVVAANYARIDVANLFTKGNSVEEVVITPSDATPTIDLALGNVFSYRPTTSFTFQTPTNPASGQTFNLIVKVASGAGGGFNSSFKFQGGAPTIPSTVGQRWLISGQYDAVDSVFLCSYLEDLA